MARGRAPLALVGQQNWQLRVRDLRRQFVPKLQVNEEVCCYE
jgi:hypothetical protein